MSTESFTFKGANGKEVFTWSWSADGRPRGILQVIHGMAEHAARYSEFAGHMNGKGYAVYAPDLRGHGRTGELNGDLFHLEGDGFNGIVEDQAILSGILREKHPGIPLFILGHSFGSFAAQEYVRRHGGGISGVILSGSCKMDGPDVKAGLFIAAASLPFGRRRPNKVLEKLSFGMYNRRIANPESRFAWLSRDAEQVRRYEEDRFCGKVMSTNFYYCFFKGLAGLYRDAGLRGTTAGPRKAAADLHGNAAGLRGTTEGLCGNTADPRGKAAALPMLIISGAEDPVGKYGAGVKKLYEWYAKNGAADVRMKLYEGARHEIINETNRREVYEDIAAWLDEHAPGSAPIL